MAKEKNKSRVFFINSADAERANMDDALTSIKDQLESGAAFFQMPIGQGQSFRGVVDLLNMKAYTYENGKLKEGDVPADAMDEAKSKRMSLVEAIAESDESLLEKYLDKGELAESDIKSGIVKGIASGQLNPVFIGSAFNNMGIDAFMNFVTDDFPSPLDMPSVKVKNDKGEDVEIKSDVAGSPLAHVFKVTSDPGIGDIFFFKVYSGSINSGDEVYNGARSQIERIGHLMLMRGKERIEIASVDAGDIAAIAKLKVTKINDTFTTKSNALFMEPIKFPEPVVSMAVLPKTKKDQDKLGIGLSKLVETDPTFKYHVDKEFAETIVTAMGDVQIDVMTKKMKERYDVDVELGKPHIPYREKITKKAEKQGKYKKQTGGHGQYGDCWLRLERLPMGGGFEFVNEIVGGAIPSKYIPAVEKGVREVMQKGVLAGYPVIDLKVTVFDGSYHDVDSSDLSFQVAASMAFKAAMLEAAPQLLEPVVELEVYTPQEYMGDLSSDISQRRGRVTGMGSGVLSAKVPMAELYQYSASLKSITSGAGTYSMQFSNYDVVPAHIAQKVIDQVNREKEEKK